jgi:hypothetical protein
MDIFLIIFGLATAAFCAYYSITGYKEWRAKAQRFK